MRLVLALGGNALLRRGEALELETQRARVREAAAALAPLARRHELLLTHGNGPQVGLLALQAEAYPGLRPYPLDVLDAESEGLIGYLIEQELRNALPGRELATLLTQVEVAADDPAFATPRKPIGPVYPEVQAERLCAERGWRVARDGAGFRRVVASPRPRRILELATIRLLLDHGVIVVCAGGGGIPVAAASDGVLRGVEAVIDKDRSAALLAEGVRADGLLLLTDADGVYEGWNTPRARLLRSATSEMLGRLPFDPGSMAPKVEAACAFAERTGGFAAIGALGEAEAVAAGRAGTWIRASARVA
jgi:carbamate kinase